MRRVELPATRVPVGEQLHLHQRLCCADHRHQVSILLLIHKLFFDINRYFVSLLLMCHLGQMSALADAEAESVQESHRPGSRVPLYASGAPDSVCEEMHRSDGQGREGHDEGRSEAADARRARLSAHTERRTDAEAAT